MLAVHGSLVSGWHGMMAASDPGPHRVDVSKEK